MRRLSLFVCGIALFSAAPLSAQQILPDQFAAWQQGSHPPIVMWPRTPGVQRPDPGPYYTRILIESGVTRVEEHYYEKSGAELTIRLFKLRDPSSAFEVYTSLLRPGIVPSNVGQVSAFDKDGVLVLEGSLVLESTANVSKEDLGA